MVGTKFRIRDWKDQGLNITICAWTVGPGAHLCWFHHLIFVFQCQNAWISHWKCISCTIRGALTILCKDECVSWGLILKQWSEVRICITSITSYISPIPSPIVPTFLSLFYVLFCSPPPFTSLLLPQLMPTVSLFAVPKYYCHNL